MGIYGYQWIPTLKYPSIHGSSNWDPCCDLERVPKVSSRSVSETVIHQILLYTTSKLINAQELLQHSYDGRTFLVGENVVHCLCILWRNHLNRASRNEGVGVEGRSPFDAKSIPTTPFGSKCVRSSYLHEGRKSLLKPYAVPPVHSH